MGEPYKLRGRKNRGRNPGAIRFPVEVHDNGSRYVVTAVRKWLNEGGTEYIEDENGVVYQRRPAGLGVELTEQPAPSEPEPRDAILGAGNVEPPEPAQ